MSPALKIQKALRQTLKIISLSTTPDSGLSPPFMIDYLLIGKQSPGKPEKLLDGVRASCVWLLPGLSAPVRRRYLQACAERDIPVWDAGREGMLCIPLGKNLLRETHR